MSWTIHPENFLSSARSAEAPTIPEKPDTVDAQMKQLEAGKRRVVMIPQGTKMPSGIPKHLHVLRVPKAGNFIFDHKAIAPREIRRAAKFNRLPEILGAADGGMGAPDKTELQSPVAVVGKDRDGIVTQGSLTDQEHLPETVEQTDKLASDVSVEDPEQTISERNAWRIQPHEFLAQFAS
jgi:hypothetical protein